MGRMTNKFKKNKMIDIKMSIKFKCEHCGYEKLIPREAFQKMTNETFKDNPIFLCKNCNIRMNPITIEVDY